MKKPTSRRSNKKDPAAGLPIRRTVAAYDRAVAAMETVLREWIGQRPYAQAARLARTPGASYSSLREFHLKRASIQHETLVAILQNIELTGPDRKRCDDLRVEFLACRDEIFRYVRRRLRSVEPKIAFRLIARQAERQDAAAPDRTTIETLAGPESERRVRAGTVRNIA